MLLNQKSTVVSTCICKCTCTFTKALSIRYSTLFGTKRASSHPSWTTWVHQPSWICYCKWWLLQIMINVVLTLHGYWNKCTYTCIYVCVQCALQSVNTSINIHVYWYQTCIQMQMWTHAEVHIQCIYTVLVYTAWDHIANLTLFFTVV